jgi:hypothetical protein
MGFYTDIRDDVAIPLVEEYGQSITVKRYVDGDWERKFSTSELKYYWEDSEGTIVWTDPSGEPVEYSGYGVVTFFSEDQIDGTNIQQSDRLIIAVSISEPQIGDVFVIGSTEYKYVNHKTVSPGGTDILYKVQVRI